MSEKVFSISKNFSFKYNIQSEKQKNWELKITEQLNINKGFVAVLGESGSGKSTLVSILSGFENLSLDQKKHITYYISKDLNCCEESKDLNCCKEKLENNVEVNNENFYNHLLNSQIYGDFCCYPFNTEKDDFNCNEIIQIDNQSLNEISDDEKIKVEYSDKKFKQFKNESFGYIFQRCYESKPLSAIDNIALPLFIKKIPKQDIYNYCEDLLNALNLKNLKDSPANELSGGQLTRIGILRGIAQQPKVLFADEPANNLDSQNAGRIMEILKQWKDQTNGTVIMVTHHPEHAFKYADQIIVFQSVEKNKGSIIYQECKKNNKWSEEEKENIQNLLKLKENFNNNFPESKESIKKKYSHYFNFLFKAAIKNIISKADASRTISWITFSAFLILFLMLFSGNQLVHWFTIIDKMKNNTDYLRKFEISVAHPPGLSKEVQNEINNLTANKIRNWITIKVINEFDDIEKICRKSTFNSLNFYICNQNAKSEICNNLSNNLFDINNSSNELTAFVDLLENYNRYLIKNIQQNMISNNYNLQKLKFAEQSLRHMIRLSEFLLDIIDIEDNEKIATIYPRWESGPEFVKANGDRMKKTTTMRWLDKSDPFYNISSLKYLTNPGFRFSSNQDEGIIIDKETLVDEFGYDINAKEVKILYGSFEEACVPVKAVLERMPEPDKYRIVTTFGFGEKIRSTSHHCDERKKFYQIEIEVPSNNYFDNVWKKVNKKNNFDRYKNKIVNFSKRSDKIIELYCNKQFSKTKKQWTKWLKNVLSVSEEDIEIRFKNKWEYLGKQEVDPPFICGSVYTISKNIVPALGEYISQAYRENRYDPWRITAFGYEDKIRFAKQSETLLESVKEIGIGILGILFILFLTTNMLINLRNKAPEISIFRAMGASIFSIFFIFISQILIIMFFSISLAILIVSLLYPFSQYIFEKNIILSIWKNFDEQRDAIAAIQANSFIDRLLSIICVNDMIIIGSIVIVIIVVCIMLIRVRFSSNYGISKILKER